MPKKLIGLQTPVFGTIGDTEIIVDNIDESFDGDWEDLKDGDGDIVSAVASGHKGEVTMDFIIKNGVAASYTDLQRGVAITLPAGETDIHKGSTVLYLVNWKKTKSRGGWFSGSLSASYFPAMS